jgi:hypothetical protein
MTWFRATFHVRAVRGSMKAPDTCRQAQSMTTTDAPAVDPSVTVTG